jgi:hypothetical protein
MTGALLAEAAGRLAGTKFRLHGRDPATGLDCVGLLAAALAACGKPWRLPNGYPLRAHRLAGLEDIATDCGFHPAEGDFRAGDVALVRTSPCQFHLVIALQGGGFVHADAGLRRVVRCTGPLAWTLVSHWRLTPSI